MQQKSGTVSGAPAPGATLPDALGAMARDETELVRRACLGEEAAWQTLVSAHQMPVFRLAYLLLGDAEEAADVAQLVREAVAEYLAAASIIQRGGDAAKAMQLAAYAQQLMPENMDTRRAVNMLKSGQMLPRPGRPKTGSLAAPDEAHLLGMAVGLLPLGPSIITCPIYPSRERTEGGS